MAVPLICSANSGNDGAAEVPGQNDPVTMETEEPGTDPGTVSDPAPQEQPGAGGTLYVEVDIDFPWKNLKNALIQTAKYLTSQATGESDATGGGSDPMAQKSGRKVVMYNDLPKYTGGASDDENAPETANSFSSEADNAGSGGYVSWTDSLMDTSRYFTAQTVFGDEAAGDDFYRLSGGTGRGGSNTEELPPYTGGGVHEYDPGRGYADDDLIYYSGDMRDIYDESSFDFSGMSTDYIWHMSLADIREGVNLGYITETGDPDMPYDWHKTETDRNGFPYYTDLPVIEPGNDNVREFPSREYMGFGKKNSDDEINDIMDDIDGLIDNGGAVQTISDEELKEGLRNGTVKYIDDSNTDCLFMDTANGQCVVSSRETGTLGIIRIANDALIGIVDKLYKPTAETEKIMDSGFDITRKLAAALVPLVILLTIAGAIRAGASSVTGIAEARTSAVNLLFCIGLAFSSRWLLGKISAVSYSIASEIGKGAILFSDSMLTSLTFGSVVLIMLFTFVFIFIIIALLIEFYLAAMSLQVMYALLAALGPVFIILSSFRPLEWLRGQWLKMLLQAVVLAPANALIINLLNHISWDGGASGVLLASAMYIGCASILIAINGSVAKQVLSSAAMVASKSADFIRGGFTGSGGLNLAGFAASGGFGALGTALSHGENNSTDGNNRSVNTVQGAGNTSPAGYQSAGTQPGIPGKKQAGIPASQYGYGRNSSQQNLFSTLLAGTGLGGGVAAANRLKSYNERKGYVKSSYSSETAEENVSGRSFFRRYNNSVDVSDVHAIEERIRSMDTNHKLTETEIRNAADSASKMIAVAYQGARNAGLEPMNGYQGNSMEQGAGNILDFGIARSVQMHAEHSGHAQQFMDAIAPGERPGIDAFRRNEGSSYYEQGILIAGEFMESHASGERNFGEAAAEVTDQLGQSDLMRNIRW